MALMLLEIKETKMKIWFCKTVFATAVISAIAVSLPSAQAQANGCSNATLKGEYAFSVTAYTPPQVVAGIKTFDGNGNFTQRDYIGDSLRKTGQTDFSTGETGTYTVNSDCTGSAVINLNVPGGGGVIKVVFVISDGGRHIHEVVSEFTPPFSPVPVPAQTSADDWKIDKDSDHH